MVLPSVTHHSRPAACSLQGHRPFHAIEPGRARVRASVAGPHKRQGDTMTTRKTRGATAAPRGGGRPRSGRAVRAPVKPSRPTAAPAFATVSAGGDECHVLIVAIGASAGGVEAVSRLLRRLP